jgi:hypothetical protein
LRDMIYPKNKGDLEWIGKMKWKSKQTVK